MYLKLSMIHHYNKLWVKVRDMIYRHCQILTCLMNIFVLFLFLTFRLLKQNNVILYLFLTCSLLKFKSRFCSLLCLHLLVLHRVKLKCKILLFSLLFVQFQGLSEQAHFWGAFGLYSLITLVSY